MNRKELNQNYWRYYKVLESKVINTATFVEIDTRNYLTFSNEFALLLQAIGAELDNFFKQYCGYGLSDRKNITDYASHILQTYPDIVNQRISITGRDIELQPFFGWNADQASQSLNWWKAFTDIKHNRSENIASANLENVLNILAALFLLEMKSFGLRAKVDTKGHLEEPDRPDEKSELFHLKGWEFRYIPIGENFALIDGSFYMIDDD